MLNCVWRTIAGSPTFMKIVKIKKMFSIKTVFHVLFKSRIAKIWNSIRHFASSVYACDFDLSFSWLRPFSNCLSRLKSQSSLLTKKMADDYFIVVTRELTIVTQNKFGKSRCTDPPYSNVNLAFLWQAVATVENLIFENVRTCTRATTVDIDRCRLGEHCCEGSNPFVDFVSNIISTNMMSYRSMCSFSNISKGTVVSEGVVRRLPEAVPGWHRLPNPIAIFVRSQRVHQVGWETCRAQWRTSPDRRGRESLESALPLISLKQRSRIDRCFSRKGWDLLRSSFTSRWDLPI